MAITATVLTQNKDAVNRTSYTTASVSPSANKLVLIFISSYDFTATTPTVSGGGMTTWTLVANKETDPRITILRALQASPGSGAATIDFGAASQLSCCWAIVEFGNVDTSGTNGSGAIVQSATNGGTATSLTVTLAAFGSADNATAGGFIAQLAGQDQAPGTGFTELAEQDTTEGTNTLFVEWRVDNDTTVNFSSASSVRREGIALELKHAAAAVKHRRTLLGVGR